MRAWPVCDQCDRHIRQSDICVGMSSSTILRHAADNDSIKTISTYLHNIYQVSTNIPPGSPRVRAAAHLHPPGPLPQQAAAQAPGQGRGHLVGHPRQAPAHAQEGRQGALPER